MIVYDADWVQGRGIYGGLIFATLIRVLEQNALFEIRNLSVELAAPVLPDLECRIKRSSNLLENSSRFYVAQENG